MTTDPEVRAPATPARPWRRRLLRCTFALIPLVVLAVLAEGALRIADVGAFEVGLPSKSAEPLGTLTAPDGRTSQYREGRHLGAPATFNELGYRGWLLHEEKPAGTLRVVTMGDSFTFGSGVTDEHTWPERLRLKIEDRGPGGAPVEVLNFGQAAANTVAERGILERDVLRFSPDVIVLGFTLFNDAETRAQYVQASAERTRMRTEAPLHRRAAKWLQHNSHAVNFVIGLVRRGARRQAMLDHLHAQYATDAPGWIACRDALRGIADRCREREIPLLVVLFPPLQEDTALNEWSRYPATDVHETIRAVLADRPGVAVIDLVPHLVPLEGRRIWIHGDAHPNPLFYERVADVLADEVLAALSER